MNRSLVAVLFAATALAACQREAAPPAPVPAPASTPAPASAPEPALAAAPTAIDATTLPGTFTATLPCADCPGIDVSLALAPDGRYELTQVMQEQKDGTTVEKGGWALDADQRLHLQPDGNAAEQLYAVDAIDRLTQLGRDGKRSGGTETSLERAGPAAPGR